MFPKSLKPTKKKFKINIFGTKNSKLKKEIKEIIIKVLKDEKSTVTELNIILCDDQFIQKLNKKFLKRNYPTDVLAFNFDNNFLGEIYVSKNQTLKQAKEDKVKYSYRLKYLILHGLFHLLSYSHSEMEKLITNYL
ncbi:MAG: rRNA maturation RNase YbeY [candidate division WOR-3 bacterium]|nr:rRNA maturation RNase YbeY [candidate division WOR-3 bacterium]MCX7836926.1 rRNA maturation RNase YbeY [candidate division WOR-3 bacterium]MDW8114590.1 rRNA maturation RNase YbeY [candidate division WOR-3 bacterium]